MSIHPYTHAYTLNLCGPQTPVWAPPAGPPQDQPTTCSPHPLSTISHLPSSSFLPAARAPHQSGERPSRRRDVDLRLRRRHRRRLIFLLLHHRLSSRVPAPGRLPPPPPPARRQPPTPPPPPQADDPRRRRRRQGRGRGRGRVARGAVGGGVAGAARPAPGPPRGGRRRRPRRARLRGRRRRGPLQEPHGRRPRGAQGLRRPGIRLQLRRDPRAPRHAPGARALLLHDPASRPRRPPPPRRHRRRHAARHQLEDLQPRRQPGRGEGAAQVLGAGGGVHRPPLQLIDLIS